MKEKFVVNKLLARLKNRRKMESEEKIDMEIEMKGTEHELERFTTITIIIYLM